MVLVAHLELLGLPFAMNTGLAEQAELSAATVNVD